MKILCFGSLNLDLVYDVAHIVAPGETISSSRADVFCGGKGLNQSIALARAGADTYLAGSIGEDGAMLAEAARDSGVNTGLLRRLDTRTGSAIIQCSSAGENSIILNGGANQCNDPAYIEEVLAHFQAGDMILLQNEINYLDRIMEKAAEKGMTVVLNPSPFDEKLSACPLNRVSIFLLNEVEGQFMTGEGEPDRMMAKLRARYPAAQIVLTLGSGGVRYWDGERVYVHGIYPVQVEDTTGAGDTFTGYFLTARAEGLPPQETLRLASKASALAVSVKGAVPSIPLRGDVDAWQPPHA